jgi:hypothetical protein
MRLLPAVVAACFPFTVLAQGPLVPKPVAPRPAGAKPVAPPSTVGAGQASGQRPPPPQTKPGEVDWRGLEEGKKPGKPAESPVTALVQNAPYRIEIATTDGRKVSLTNAFTLERRRIYEAEGIAGLAFSPDGHWLYVATNRGGVVAVQADSAQVVPVATLQLQPGEAIVELAGAGGVAAIDLTVVLGQGPVQPAVCPPWQQLRRARLKRDPVGAAVAKPVWADGGLPDNVPSKLAAGAPNTRFTVSVQSGNLQVRGQFGNGDWRMNRTPLPADVSYVQWQRDSQGVVALWPRKTRGGCKRLWGLRAWRNSPGKEQGWVEWTLPEQVDLIRGDLARPAEWTPDGMRLIGVEPRGVVLIEPAPRHRGPVALVAPPSTVWPRVRPGVRPVPATVSGNLRLLELLLEQGDLDAAAKHLAIVGKAGGAEVDRLRKRLAHLEETRQRRVDELRATLEELRSDKAPPVALPQASSPTQPANSLTQPAPAK